MKYKVGQKVRVKPIKEIKRLMQSNPGPERNPEMTPMCWKEWVILSSVDNTLYGENYYRIKDDRGYTRSFLESWLDASGVPLFI